MCATVTVWIEHLYFNNWWVLWFATAILDSFDSPYGLEEVNIAIVQMISKFIYNIILLSIYQFKCDCIRVSCVIMLRWKYLNLIITYLPFDLSDQLDHFDSPTPIPYLLPYFSNYRSSYSPDPYCLPFHPHVHHLWFFNGN